MADDIPVAREKKTTPADDLDKARKRAIFSVTLNLALASSKAVAGIVSSSSALISDAIHSATDVFASLASWFSLWLADKKHPSFPYGLYKAENIATLVSATAIIVAGYEIARRAIFGPETTPDLTVAMPVAAASFLISLVFGITQVRAGKKLGSPALEADGKDYLTDSVSTSVVIIGLAGSWLGLNIERWAAATVSLFVFKAGIQLMTAAVKGLMDAAIDRDTERRIISVVAGMPAVRNVCDFMGRQAGGRYIVDLDVELRTTSHEAADRIADQIEQLVKENFPRVVMARVRPHFHPPLFIKRISPVSSPKGELSPHLAGAPWFLIETVDRKTGEVISVETRKNPFRKHGSKKGLRLGRWLLEMDPDQLILYREHPSTAVTLLKEAGVNVLIDKGRNHA
jgi:cation diffusion facilitator family transporter